jgi:mRNA interferase RelE/StbE
MTELYSIRFKSSVKKDLRSIPKQDVLRILNALEHLAENPRPINSKPLTGRDAWRIRVGQYRAIYTINDQEIVIEIIRIAHRKNVYR